MLTIDKHGIITVSKGDDFQLPLFINQGTETKPIRYVLAEKDLVQFRLMAPNQSFENAIIRKDYTYQDVNEHDDVVVKFNREDTLLLLPGKYYYEIKIQLYDSETQGYKVNTISPKTEFFIAR